jgi:hypothetical protein
LKLPEGGIFGWKGVITKFGELFDGLNVAGFVVRNKLDLTKGVKETVKVLSDEELKISDYVSDVIDQLELRIDLEAVDTISALTSNISLDGIKNVETPKFEIDKNKDFQKIFIQKSLAGITEEEIENYDMMSLLISLIPFNLLLVILFVICLLYFLIMCCTCCCCRAKDSEPPSVCQTIIFFAGVICIFCVGLFAFLIIPQVNDIINVVRNIDSIVPALGKEIDTSIDGIEAVVGELLEDVPDFSYSIPGKVLSAFDKLVDEVNGLIKDVKNDVVGPNGFFSHFESGSEFNSTLKEINVLMKDLPEEYQVSEIDAYSEIEGFKDTITQKLDESTEILEGKGIREKISNLTKEIDNLKINETADTKELFKDAKETTEDLKNYSLLDEMFADDKELRDLVDTVIETVDKYWWLVDLLIVLIGLFFFSLITCWTFTFYNKCCCCSCCCSNCSCCFPCCQLIFILVFGIVTTVLMFVFIIVGSESFKAMDVAIEEVINYIQPERTIEVPKFGLDVNQNNSLYEMKIPQLKFQFSKNIAIINEFLTEDKNTGFAKLFNIADFFKLNTIADAIQGWNTTIAAVIRSYVSDLVGSYSGDYTYFISEANNISDFQYSIDINEYTQPAKDKLDECTANSLLDDETKVKCQNLQTKIKELEDIFNGEINDAFIETKENINIHLINKIDSDGFPQLYDKVLADLFNSIFTFILGKVSTGIKILPQLLDSFHIHLLRGPLALIYNIIIYDLCSFVTYASLTLHLSLLGYFLVCLALKMRSPHLLKEKKNAADDDSELDNLDDDDMISRRKRVKKETKTSRKQSYFSDVTDSESSKIKSKAKTNLKSEKKPATTKDESDSYTESYDEKPNRSTSRKNSRVQNDINGNSPSFWLDFA